MSFKILIVGGGASGVFAAIQAAQTARDMNKKVMVTLLESSANLLKKVRISGGGRCNVTHHQFDVKSFSNNYPRGQRELLSPLTRFQAEDVVNWFSKRGVRLVAESDGRMFPSTNTSETIIDCFKKELNRLGVEVKMHYAVTGIESARGGQYKVNIRDKEPLIADKVLVATGSSPMGYKIAEQLGLHITERAPSLFTFKIKHPLLKDLSGISFEKVHLKLICDGLRKNTFKQSGPLLVTHWGLSGPAVLKLSAWAARELKKCDYKAKLIVNFLACETLEEVLTILNSFKEKSSSFNILNRYPEALTKRFWSNLLEVLKIKSTTKWAELSKKEMNKLAESLFATSFNVNGQNRFKEEFVECGGVSLKEIDFKSFESKKCPGLYFTGELLDVDGITGGFNFQNAWTGGWVAGAHMIHSLVED